ncbi:MAG: hypothetical protein KTR21_12415 [Rhodobacteraceae bacterium]|nr:hypothetical protein [Paracoccaceae bacterium]
MTTATPGMRANSQAQARLKRLKQAQKWFAEKLGGAERSQDQPTLARDAPTSIVFTLEHRLTTQLFDK